ncbi:hypothetical protein KKC60_04405, partial [Patescibacteria group bacterium]|nr:hypothetical protein [Patescibacteria group bacterium]
MDREQRSPEVEEEEIKIREIVQKIEKGDFDFGELQNLSPEENKEIALGLIHSDYGDRIVYYFDKFKGLDSQEMALELFKSAIRLDVYFRKFPHLDHKKIVQKIFEAGKGSSVARCLNDFKDLDHEEIALKLIEAGEGGALINYFDKFHGLDHQEIALKLIEAGKGRDVAVWLYKFKNIDHKRIALKLIKKGDGESVIENIDEFKDVEAECVLALIDADYGEAVIQNLGLFQDLDHKEIVLRLIENKKGAIVAENLDKFQGLDQYVALKLIEAEKARAVTNHLDRFHNLDFQLIADKLIAEGTVWGIAENLDKFQGLDHKETALKIIAARRGGGVALVAYFENFNLSDSDEEEIVALLFEDESTWEAIAENFDSFKNLNQNRSLGSTLLDSFLNEDDFELAQSINSKYSPSLDRLLSRLEDLCNEYATYDLYQTFKAVESGQLSEDSKALGVKHTGETGSNELRNILRDKRQQYLEGAFDPQELQDNKVLFSWFKSIIRYDEAEWSGNTSFEDIITYYQQNQDKLRPLPEEYVPSDILHIIKRKQKLEGYSPQEGFQSRYTTLLNSIKAAHDLNAMPEGQGVKELQLKLKDKRQEVISNLKNKEAQQDNP